MNFAPLRRIDWTPSDSGSGIDVISPRRVVIALGALVRRWLDSKLLQILVVVHVLLNRITDPRGSLLAVILLPLGVQLLIALRSLLLLQSQSCAKSTS